MKHARLPPFAAPPDLGCVAAAAASDIVQVPQAGALPARSGVRLARTNSDILKVGQSRSSSGWGWMGSREKIFEVRGPKSLTCADPTPIAKLTGQSEGDESFPSRGAKVEETRVCAIERRHYDTHYTLETMFAMTSLVGTPVVATPARATRAVRSTETVAIFKKGAPKAAPKKGAKKVRPKPVHRRIRHRRGPSSPGVILRRRARAPADRASRTPAINIARAVHPRDRTPPLSARATHAPAPRDDGG